MFVDRCQLYQVIITDWFDFQKHKNNVEAIPKRAETLDHVTDSMLIWAEKRVVK